jgi:hypothetical protein
VVFVVLLQPNNKKMEMKNVLFKVCIVCVLCSYSVSLCAQVDLKNVLGAVSGKSSVGEVASTLTSVFSPDKQATADNIIGTWTYTEPAIVLQSDNALTNAAAKIASGKIEKKLQTYLTQYGIKPGALIITFNEDGTFVETLNKKTSKGKWTVKNSKLQLTISGIKVPSVTTQLNGKNLMFVTDATKLLNLFKALGKTSNNSTLSSVTSLMKGINGMQVGVTLTKK